MVLKPSYPKCSDLGRTWRNPT